LDLTGKDYPPSDSLTAMLLEPTSNGDTNWAMPTITDGDMLSTQQQERAKKAREFHHNLGHPGDRALSLASDNGNLMPSRVTSQDLRNATILLGPCIPFIQGKMKAPPENSSRSLPANNIGDKLHMDIIPIHTSIGGNNFILFSVDEKSDYIIVVPMVGKSNMNLVKAVDVIIGIFVQKGNMLSQIVTDNEINLRSLEIQLRTVKISFSTTPAGLHQKKAERTIQTVKKVGSDESSIIVCLTKYT
jgi:hypothetical protein